MFDVGFSELVVIGIVALLVLGPERLPRLARDVGRWVGRARRYANRMREELDREVELSELRRLRDEIEAKARETAAEADEQVARIGASLDDVAQPRPVTAQTAGTGVPQAAEPRPEALPSDAVEPARKRTRRAPASQS